MLKLLSLRMQLIILFSIVASVTRVACQDGIFDNPLEEVFETLKSNSTRIAQAACQIAIGADMGNPQPLYIQPGTEQFFHPTDRNGFIPFTSNQQIELFCTNGFATPSGTSGNLIRISCLGRTRFMFNSISYNFNEFTCRNWPTSIAQRRLMTNRCYNQGILVDVGFQVEHRFLKVFSVCHDPRLEQNYYTEYQLTPASDGQERSVTRPGWRQGDFHPGKNVDSLHTRINQRNTIATILESTSAAQRYIEEVPSDVYLARGHLAAVTDFITANEQRSTFFFINTAPQWQTFNALNWYAVELSSRRLASDRNIFLDVYTGTFGVTQLQDDRGINHQIFIDFPNRQIPVPMLFYKILVNRADNSGIVLLGVNNPHLTLSEIMANYVICHDVSSRISYINWQRDNLRRGYSYACEVNDFLSRVPHIPGIQVKSLLV